MTRPLMNRKTILVGLAIVGVIYGGLALSYCAGARAQKVEQIGAKAPDVVQQVNTAINTIKPGPNPRRPDGTWDCEDFAFAKLGALEALGIKGSEVWWVVISNGREDHAVLVLADGRVLDNRFQTIASQADLTAFHGYRFVRRIRSLEDATSSGAR